MYAHEIGSIAADPYGAALTTPKGLALFPILDCDPVLMTGCDGRYGERWALTAIGPIPGPPPPWGMQKVLWRLRWDTSEP